MSDDKRIGKDIYKPTQKQNTVSLAFVEGLKGVCPEMLAEIGIELNMSNSLINYREAIEENNEERIQCESQKIINCVKNLCEQLTLQYNATIKDITKQNEDLKNEVEKLKKRMSDTSDGYRLYGFPLWLAKQVEAERSIEDIMSEAKDAYGISNTCVAIMLATTVAKRNWTQSEQGKWKKHRPDLLDDFKKAVGIK